MTPYQRAQQIYHEEACARNFHADLVGHLNRGYVLSTPTTFIMARPVDRTKSYREITDPSVTHAHPDAWWIYLAVGKISEFFKHEPHELPYVGWEVSNVPRFYVFNRVRRKVLHEERTNGELCAMLQGRRGSSPATTPATGAIPGGVKCGEERNQS